MLRWLYRLSDRIRHRARSQAGLCRVHPDQALGRNGEDLAHRYLQSLGYTIVARNFRTATGSAELDLIARDGETVVFVEVKSRASDEFGAPDRAIGEEKLRHMARAARDYCSRSRQDPSRSRFDVVAVVVGNPNPVTHYRNAYLISLNSSTGSNQARV